MRRLQIAFVAVLACAAALAVGAAAFSVIQEPLPTGFTGQPYNHQFRVRGGNPPYTFSVKSGKLPPGLFFTTDGLLSGSPAKSGSWQFYVEGSYRYGTNPPLYSQRRFTLDVLVGLTIRNPVLRPATRGVPYAAKLTASGGGAQAWSITGGRLPHGLELARNGVISGSPTREGDFVFTVRVADDPRVARKVFVLTVTETLQVSVPSVPQAVVGSPFAITVRVVGGLEPYSWVVRNGVRPRGVDLSNGALAGTPQVAGRHAFTVAVTDSLGNTRAVPLMIVVHPRLKIPLQVLAPATRGLAYRARIAARGGAPPLTFEVVGGHLPPGLRLDPRTGVLAGEARAKGRFPFTVEVVDQIEGTHRRTLALAVR